MRDKQEMWLSMSIGYYLKGRKEDHRGITQENVTYSKDRSTTFSRLMAMIFKDVLEWYLRFTDTDDLNGELDEFRRLISDVRIIEDSNDANSGGQSMTTYYCGECDETFDRLYYDPDCPDDKLSVCPDCGIDADEDRKRVKELEAQIERLEKEIHDAAEAQYFLRP